jgi:hypothetical protein
VAFGAHIGLSSATGHETSGVGVPVGGRSRLRSRDANETAGFIKEKRREDIADDALANTIALVAISPDDRVRIEVSGSGLLSFEVDFVKTISARQALFAQLILNPSQPVPDPSRR